MQREIVKRKRNITTNLIASWCSLVPPEYFAQILIFEMIKIVFTNVLLWKHHKKYTSQKIT